MHEKRNFLLTLAVIGFGGWTLWAWFVMDPAASLIWFHRGAGGLLFLGASGWLVHVYYFEDKLEDHLRATVGEIYFECDGITFMPTVRVNHGQAELSVYYQNNHENMAQVVVHLRPPEDCFVVRRGLRDVHLAFVVGGGAFGVIHQPIAVPDHLQGEVLNVQLAAAVHFPKCHGKRLRRHMGQPCGTLLIDFVGAVFRTGIHEASGEIELTHPVTLHLAMPRNVAQKPPSDVLFKQELIAGADVKVLAY